MKAKSLMVLSAVGLGWASGAVAAPVTYDVAPDKSQFTWTGSKEIGDSHTGSIKVSGGTVTVEASEIKAAELTIDMTSIVNTDVKDATYNKKLVEHLKSDDFFKVDAFKTATFKATKPAKIEGGKAVLAGQLQIRGKTADVVINLADVKVADKEAMASGKMTFDRTKFDVKYNSASFPDLFKVAKDKIIKNDVALDFKLVANKSSSAKL
jgi:polyisoprenoid-binding protein YceI